MYSVQLHESEAACCSNGGESMVNTHDDTNTAAVAHPLSLVITVVSDRMLQLSLCADRPRGGEATEN